MNRICGFCSREPLNNVMLDAFLVRWCNQTCTFNKWFLSYSRSNLRTEEFKTICPMKMEPDLYKVCFGKHKSP